MVFPETTGRKCKEERSDGKIVLAFAFGMFIACMFDLPNHRQAERVKREKAQSKRWDDLDPNLRPEEIVPVTRFQGSRLVSGSSSSPFQQNLNSGTGDKFGRAKEAARLSSKGASVGAAIMVAENSLETEADYKEDLKIMLKGVLREKSDLFNSECPEEDKVKLGEDGWEERCYALLLL